jgi:WD40 repeat protein
MVDRKPSEDSIIGIATTDPKWVVAVESNRRHAFILDAETGKPIGDRWDLPGQVFSTSPFPNGREIIIAFTEGFIQSFDVATRKPTGAAIPWRGHGTAIHLSPDGRVLAVVTGRMANQTLNLHDPKTGLILGPTQTFDRSNEIRCLAYRPDSSVLATGHANGTVHFWNLSSGMAGKAAQIRCWAEMIGRAEWIAQPTETMRNLVDQEVGQRRKRLLDEWGLDSAMRPANR